MESRVGQMPPRELLSAPQAAEIAGVGERSWWRFVSSGKAPHPVRLGRAVRWRKAELAKWIADGCPQVRTGGSASDRPAVQNRRA